VLHDYSSFQRMLAMYVEALGIPGPTAAGRFSTGRPIEQEIGFMASTTTRTTNPAGIPAPAELLTPKEFAKAAKVSLSWLAKARRRGDGPPFVRFGRSVRYFPPGMPE
jgi:hypothetical protein